jgi:hypothetical protein
MVYTRYGGICHVKCVMVKMVIIPVFVKFRE